jgi:hypothetical protein
MEATEGVENLAIRARADDREAKAQLVSASPPLLRRIVRR